MKLRKSFVLLSLLFKPRFVLNLYNLFHLNPKGIAIVNTKTFKFMYINDTFEKWLGYDKDELVGHQFFEFVDKDYLDATIDTTKLALSNVIADYRNGYRTKAGELIFLIWEAYRSGDRWICYIDKE